MSEWKALVGRISIFPSQSDPMPSALEVFKAIWGVDPDSFKKQANPLLPTIAQGTQSGMVATCSTNPGRLDVELSPVRSFDLPDSSFPLIEDTSQLHNELEKIIHAIAQGHVSGPVSRVALVVHMVTLCSDVTEANKIVTSIMPAKYHVGITDEGDFIFQINQTYASHKHSRITMNSLRKWSIERFQVLSIRVQMGGGPVPASTGVPSTTLTKEFLAASLMLESNNVPVSDLLTTEEQSSLLLESLVEIAQTQRNVGLNIEGFEK